MRKWFAVLLAVLLCLALVACGGGENAFKNDTKEPTTASEPTSDPTRPDEDSTDPTPTDPVPTDPQPTDPSAPADPTLPDESQDPGGFGPIF